MASQIDYPTGTFPHFNSCVLPRDTQISDDQVAGQGSSEDENPRIEQKILWRTCG